LNDTSEKEITITLRGNKIAIDKILILVGLMEVAGNRTIDIALCSLNTDKLVSDLPPALSDIEMELILNNQRVILYDKRGQVLLLPG